MINRVEDLIRHQNIVGNKSTRGKRTLGLRGKYKLNIKKRYLKERKEENRWNAGHSNHYSLACGLSKRIYQVTSQTQNAHSLQKKSEIMTQICDGQASVTICDRNCDGPERFVKGWQAHRVRAKIVTD